MDGPYISHDIYEMVSMVFHLHSKPDHLATGLDSMDVELNTGPMGWDRAGGLKRSAYSIELIFWSLTRFLTVGDGQSAAGIESS
jgi:hypothetical protein